MDKLKPWEFLKNNHLAVLATISPEKNAPHASLIYYLTDPDVHLYIVSKKDSRKFSNINKNNKVALVVGQEIEPITLQLEGTAEIVKDPNKIDELTKKYLDSANTNTSFPNWPPIMKIPTDDEFTFIQITINWFKLSDFNGSQASITEGTPEDWK